MVMPRSVALRVDLKSNDEIMLVPIGEAARRLGLASPALRYYEERGLVRPATTARPSIEPARR